MSAILQEVIVSSIARKGDGVETPIRVVNQVWTLEGQLIADNDPLSFSIEKIMEVMLQAESTLAEGLSVANYREKVFLTLKHG